MERGSANAAGGFVRAGHDQLLIEARGRFQSLRDIEETVVTMHDQEPVLVRHLAKVVIADYHPTAAAEQAGRARKVSLFAFQSSTNVWWNTVANKLTRAQNLTVWQIPSEQSQALAQLAQRGMQLQITVQDGTLWVNDGVKDSVEITPIKLMGPDT